MCCLQYPFPATELKELERKVLNDKMQKHPNWVNSEFVELFSKMLKKDPTKRPTIEEIILSDVF
jgi:serine/threonine protein kinase